MENHEIKKSIIDLIHLNKSMHRSEIIREFDAEDADKVFEIMNKDLVNVLVFESSTGYRFRHKFGPRPKAIHPGLPRFSMYPQHVMDAAAYPDTYTTPEVSNLAQLDQDQVGDCVGCSGASGSKLSRLRILKVPTPLAQLQAIQRNVVNSDGITVDILPDDTVSAAGVYNLARARMIPPPAKNDDGAQISDAADAITKDGIVPEWMWPTGKTENASGPVFYFTPPKGYTELELKQVGLYKFGCPWSQLDGVNGDPTLQIMSAVTVYGWCWMAMPVFDPVSTSTIVGYHAIAIVGWTRDTAGNRRWQFVNSWNGFTPLINTISDVGYMQPRFKSGDIQLISVMTVSAVPFIDKVTPVPVPVPTPTPTPTPTPEPVPTPSFWVTLIDDIISFFVDLFGRKPGKKMTTV